MRESDLPPASVEQILGVIQKQCSEWDVRPGESEWSLSRLGPTKRDISFRLDYHYAVPLNRLRKMVKDGLIVQHGGEGYDRHPRFITPENAAAIEAEKSLTPGERAERTATSIREMYEHNRAEYGDRLASWPVSTNRAAVISDGISDAVESGMLREVRIYEERRYIPEDLSDAWQEAYDAEQDREKARKKYLDGLSKELDRLLPQLGERNAYELNSAQLEEIVLRRLKERGTQHD